SVLAAVDHRAQRASGNILAGVHQRGIEAAEAVVFLAPSRLELVAHAEIQRQRGQDLVIILTKAGQVPHAGAGFLVVVDVPAVDLAQEEVRVRRTCRGNRWVAPLLGCAASGVRVIPPRPELRRADAIEGEVARADVAPVRVVLIALVELAAHFYGVTA